MKRSWILACLAGLLALTACSGGGTATPTPWMSSANLPGQIVYLDAWEDGLHLCLILPDRSDLRCQAMDENLAASFTWSADGSRVAFLRQPVDQDTAELWVMEAADVTSARKLLDATFHYPSAPSLSPDGKTLVVEARDLTSSLSDLLTVNPADGVARPLLAVNSAYDEMAPDISADGRLIFVSDRPEEATTTLKIYSASLDGADLQRLTDPLVNSYAPTWSPDGSQIAFLRRSGLADDPADGLYVMKADGSEARQVAQVAYLTYENDPPAWSPDGKWLAFQQGEEAGEEELVTPQVWVTLASGGQPAQLSQSGVSNFLASWSPDSRALLYTQRDGSDYFLYMVKPDGSDRQKFIECSLCAFGAWSPK